MTEQFRKDNVRMTDALRSVYGDEIVLTEGDDESVPHRIVAEFAVGDRAYAVLQSEELRKEDEVEIFRVAKSPSGQWELETIEDDDEWEHVAELYDEMVFASGEST
jgi:uncharacterized protein YrzB (UPF0473 family)